MEAHDSATSLIAAVESGRGVAMVPSCMACLAGDRLKLVPLKPEPAPLIVGTLTWATALTTAQDKFITAARQAAAD